MTSTNKNEEFMPQHIDWGRRAHATAFKDWSVLGSHSPAELGAQSWDRAQQRAGMFMGQLAWGPSVTAAQLLARRWQHCSTATLASATVEEQPRPGSCSCAATGCGRRPQLRLQDRPCLLLSHPDLSLSHCSHCLVHSAIVHPAPHVTTPGNAELGDAVPRKQPLC